LSGYAPGFSGTTCEPLTSLRTKRELVCSRWFGRFYSLTIHSFMLFLWRLFKSTTTQKRSRHSTGSKFHAEAPLATVSEGLAQGTYAAVRARFKSMTHITYPCICA